MNYTAHEPLPKTMSAVVCHGPHDYRLEEELVPQPGPGEVVVRVNSVGICASDLKCYLGAPLFWGDKHRPAYVHAPIIAGHTALIEEWHRALHEASGRANERD